MAPLYIQALLEIWCLPYEEQLVHAKNENALKELQHRELIEPDPREAPTLGDMDRRNHPHGWRVSERGQVYVEALQRLPLPEKRWVLPNHWETDCG